MNLTWLAVGVGWGAAGFMAWELRKRTKEIGELVTSLHESNGALRAANKIVKEEMDDREKVRQLLVQAQDNLAKVDTDRAQARDELAKLRDELAKLREPKPPTYVCPHCQRSNRTYVIKLATGWRDGQNGAEPVPLGATVQCMDCAEIWHVTDKGAEVAKPVRPQTAPPPKREKPATGDADLKWPWRER